MWRAIFLVAALLLSPATHAQDVRTYIPPKAYPLLPVVKSEMQKALPGFSMVSFEEKHLFDTLITPYVASLIEHESCISLKHSRCWSPTSELKTPREQGLGLGQLTRTYRPDGTIRFDKLTEMKIKYDKDLKELSWDTLKSRPDLQIRTIVFMLRENMKALFMVKDVLQRLKMADVAYNAGLGSIKKDRQLCGLRPNCDPQVWTGNVETNSTVSRKPIYAGRSAYDISRHHAVDTTEIRLRKYQEYFFTDVED